MCLEKINQINLVIIMDTEFRDCRKSLSLASKGFSHNRSCEIIVDNSSEGILRSQGQNCASRRKRTTLQS